MFRRPFARLMLLLALGAGALAPLPAQRPVPTDPTPYPPSGQPPAPPRLAPAAPPAQPVIAPRGPLTPQQGRLLARRAAIADAQRQLAEMIYGTRIDSETVVRDFVTERDDIRSRLSATLRGAQALETRYLPDGVVEVDMFIPREVVEQVLGIGLPPAAADFFATGTGAPNPEVAQPAPPAPSDPAAPGYDFRLITVEATGTGAYPPGRENTPQGFAMARRAAVLDAYRNLGEAVMGVRVDSQTTVRDFVTVNDEIRTRFDGFVRGAQVVDARTTGEGVVEVTMQITLNELGDIVLAGRQVRGAGGEQPAAPAPGP